MYAVRLNCGWEPLLGLAGWGSNNRNQVLQHKRWINFKIQAVRAAEKDNVREGIVCGEQDGSGEERRAGQGLPKSSSAAAVVAKAGGPKRRVFGNDSGSRKEFEEKRGETSGRVNARSKDVWVNREGTIADKIFVEDIEIVEYDQSHQKGQLGTVQRQLWSSSLSDGETPSWPKRRAVMIKLQNADDLKVALHRYSDRRQTFAR